MGKLMAYFRKVHLTIISNKAAERLALTVRNMRRIDGGTVLGVTGSDDTALLPRHVDVTLRELRLVLSGRRISA